MKKILEPFQVAGAATLAANPHYLLADEPGLGKTLQAIRAAELVGSRRTLVICPASVRANWETEIKECGGDWDQWDVISYNGAKHLVGMNAPYDVLILDEVHFLKTIDSQRTQSIFGAGGVARQAHFKWALSGTPVLNRPRELYPMLKTLCPAFAGMSFDRFAQRYCGAFFDGRGINTKGATHLDELAVLLQGFMLRRTALEVFPGRVEPLVHRVPLDLTQEDLKEVNALEDEIGGREMRISSRYEEFSQLGDTSRLLRLLGNAMIPHIVGFVDDLLATVDKVVVFAYHRDVIARLQSQFTDKGYCPCVFVGGMSDWDKMGVVRSFNETPRSRVFIGQRDAAGIGINGLQTVCSTCVIAEPPWVPGATDQMIKRLDRMGQTDPLVNAYILYARNTLSAVVVQVHDRKDLVVHKLMDKRMSLAWEL